MTNEQPNKFSLSLTALGVLLIAFISRTAAHYLAGPNPGLFRITYDVARTLYLIVPLIALGGALSKKDRFRWLGIVIAVIYAVILLYGAYILFYGQWHNA